LDPNFLTMNTNRLMGQVTAIFSLFMVFFYLGVGFYLVFFSNLNYFNIQRPVMVIMGSSFILYGVYRAFRAYVKIVEVFFTKDEEED
jgi:hypothetical protein